MPLRGNQNNNHGFLFVCEISKGLVPIDNTNDVILVTSLGCDVGYEPVEHREHWTVGCGKPL